jgi:hypothetical protein
MLGFPIAGVCEDYHHLDLAWLRRRKMLTPGRVSVVTWSVGGNQVGAIPGHDNDVPKFRYIDSGERARAIYVKLHKGMRQGMVELFDGDGKSVKRDWAPRLRW